MAISVGIEAIKRKVGLEGSSWDSHVTLLMNEQISVIEYALEPGALSSSAESGLQATLNLAALEIIAGELFAEISRRPEFQLSFKLGDVEMYPRKYDNVDDPTLLIKKGWSRLAPYLKQGQPNVRPSSIGQVTGKQGEDA